MGKKLRCQIALTFQNRDLDYVIKSTTKKKPRNLIPNKSNAK
jgi:hypothetical protein